jgi:hypothetical protein
MVQCVFASKEKPIIRARWIDRPQDQLPNRIEAPSRGQVENGSPLFIRKVVLFKIPSRRIYLGKQKTEDVEQLTRDIEQRERLRSPCIRHPLLIQWWVKPHGHGAQAVQIERRNTQNRDRSNSGEHNRDCHRPGTCQHIGHMPCNTTDQKCDIPVLEEVFAML